MNLKVYEKTRYQNIYRHKKNKNYIVKINTPVDTTITNVNGSKILKLEDAIKIRDNPKLKLQKEKEVIYKDTFDDLWEKYIDYCKYDQKQGYNTLCKKEKLYKKYFKEKIDKKITKIDKDYINKFVDKLDTTNKQKNEILIKLRAFFYWCLNEEKVIIANPLQKIKKYAVEKAEMKYWHPNELTQFLNYTQECINNDKDKEIAYRMRILALIGFTLGDRVGETRALAFNSIDKDNLTISIKHSINYDRKSNDFLGNTKNYWSQRIVDISQLLVDEIENYKIYLKSLGYEINNDTLIFLNPKTKKPLTDTTLRKQFTRYCKEADVPIIRMYDLRHTYVATMMSEGKDIYLFSPRIGHNDIKTTANTYGHLSKTVRREMAEFTDKFIK